MPPSEKQNKLNTLSRRAQFLQAFTRDKLPELSQRSKDAITQGASRRGKHLKTALFVSQGQPRTKQILVSPPETAIDYESTQGAGIPGAFVERTISSTSTVEDFAPAPENGPMIPQCSETPEPTSAATEAMDIRADRPIPETHSTITAPAVITHNASITASAVDDTTATVTAIPEATHAATGQNVRDINSWIDDDVDSPRLFKGEAGMPIVHAATAHTADEDLKPGVPTTGPPLVPPANCDSSSLSPAQPLQDAEMADVGQYASRERSSSGSTVRLSEGSRNYDEREIRVSKGKGRQIDSYPPAGNDLEASLPYRTLLEKSDRDQWQRNPLSDPTIEQENEVAMSAEAEALVSTAELEGKLKGLADGSQAHVHASKADIGYLYEFIRRMLGFDGLNGLLARAVQQATSLAGPSRGPDGPRRPDASPTHPRRSVTVNLPEIQPAVPSPPRFLPTRRREMEHRYRLAQTNHRDSDATSLQAHVRLAALTFLGRSSSSDPFKPGPTPKQLAGAARGVARPDPNDPRLDLSGKASYSDWNRQVAVLFGKWYVNQVGAKTKDSGVAERAFFAHIPALCVQARNIEDVDAKQNPAFINNRRRSRRRKLSRRRFEDSMYCLDAQTTTWINRLGTEGTSEDESDGGPETPSKERPYWIIPLEWRSAELSELLRTLDRLHLFLRFTEGNKATQGNYPRVRKLRPTSRYDSRSRAVPGLPRNFYDPKWLEARSEWEFHKLQVRDDVQVDLSVPEEVKEALAHFDEFAKIFE